MPTKLQIGAAVGAGTAATTTAIAVPLATGGKEEKTDTTKTQKQDQKEKDKQEDLDPPTAKTVSVFGFSATLEDPYKGKLLDLTKKDHLDLLVKPLEESNQWWWEKLYTEIYSPAKEGDSLDDTFKSLDKAFSDNEEDKALNQACHKAYQTEKENYSFDSTSFLLGNIGKFCVNLEEPKDISEPKVEVYAKSFTVTAAFKNGIFDVEQNRPLLVMKSHTNNVLWWDWSFYKLFTQEQNRDDHFKNVNKGYHATEANSLNKVCDESYKKTTRDLIRIANQHLFSNIKKFCTPGLAPAELVLPEWNEPTARTGITTATSDGVGKVEGNKANLVDPKKENEEWWDWAHHKRFPKEEAEVAKLPVPFNEVKFGYSGTNQNKSALNQMCKEAYSKTKTDLDAKSEYQEKTLLQLIKEFCTPESFRTGEASLSTQQQ